MPRGIGGLNIDATGDYFSGSQPETKIVTIGVEIQGVPSSILIDSERRGMTESQTPVRPLSSRIAVDDRITFGPNEASRSL